MRSFLPAVGWRSLRSGDVDTLGGRIIGLPTPVEDSEAATKEYVDDSAGGNGGSSSFPGWTADADAKSVTVDEGATQANVLIIKDTDGNEAIIFRNAPLAVSPGDFGSALVELQGKAGEYTVIRLTIPDSLFGLAADSVLEWGMVPVDQRPNNPSALHNDGRVYISVAEDQTPVYVSGFGAWGGVQTQNLLRLGPDDNTDIFTVGAAGEVYAPGLPTTDPAVAGQLWCDTASGHVIKRSAG